MTDNTSTVKLTFGTPYSKTVKCPLTCPYCGKVVEFTPKAQVNLDFNKNDKIFFYTLHTKCCNKLSIATYHYHSDSDETYKSEDSRYELLSVYPGQKLTYLPDSVVNISPRFYKLYNDSEFAYLNNMFELAGSGFRNSLEVLIKDYAIIELNENPEKVSKTKLYNCIENYLPDPLLKNAADVVRILGNDYTHYQRKYEQHNVSLLKTYLDIFIKRIDANYLWCIYIYKSIFNEIFFNCIFNFIK